jgi:hypothetical protein
MGGHFEIAVRKRTLFHADQPPAAARADNRLARKLTRSFTSCSDSRG